MRQKKYRKYVCKIRVTLEDAISQVGGMKTVVFIPVCVK